MKIPTFETTRLQLRGLQRADLSSYQANFADYEVIAHLSRSVPWPYPEDGVEWYFREVISPDQGISRWTWGIFLKERPQEVIGGVELWREGVPEHRGFWLAKAHWGRGLMTEAVRPVMDYAFDALGFEALIFSNAVGNARSRRIKEKTGATLLRVEPGEFVDPAYTEREIWRLTRADWRASRRG